MKKIKTLLVLSGLVVSLLAGCDTTTSSGQTPDKSSEPASAQSSEPSSAAPSSESSAAKVLDSIRVAAEPTKKDYFVGDEFNPAGLDVKAVYNSGEETLAATDYQLSGFDSTSAGEKTITVTFSGKTATFKVNVQAVTITGIAITAEPTKKDYFVGDEFDPAGLEVKASYNNGKETVVASADYQLSGFNTQETGEQTITVTYNEKTATFKVNVQAVVLASIKVAAEPTKTSYYQDDEFDPAGLVIKAVYNNGKEEEIAAADYQLSGFDSTAGGLNTITVTYNEKTATFNVTIIGKNGIELTSAPNKVRYGVGDEFDDTGLVVSQKYADGTKRALGKDQYIVTGFDSSAQGEKTITITVGTETVSFNINVYKGAWTTTEKARMKKYLIYELPFMPGMSFSIDGLKDPEDDSKTLVPWYTAKTEFIADYDDVETYADLVESYLTADGKQAWNSYETQIGALSGELSNFEGGIAEDNLFGFDPDAPAYEYIRYTNDSDNYYAYQVLTFGIDLEGKLKVVSTTATIPYASDFDGIYYSYLCGTADGREFNDFTGYYQNAIEETARYASGAPKWAKFFNQLAFPQMEGIVYTENDGITKKGTMVCLMNRSVFYPYYYGCKDSAYFGFKFYLSFTNFNIAADKQYTSADVDALVAQYDPEAVVVEEDGSRTVNVNINGNFVELNYSFDNGQYKSIEISIEVLKWEEPEVIPDFHTAEESANAFNTALAADYPELALTYDSDDEMYYMEANLGAFTDTSREGLKAVCDDFAKYLPDYIELYAEVYGDPTASGYTQLFEGNPYYFRQIYYSDDDVVTAQIIAGVFDGELVVIALMYD